MKDHQILGLCMCTAILFCTTACNITCSANNSNLDSSDETIPTSISSAAVKESYVPTVSEAGTKGTESWVSKASMSTARFDFGCAVIGGKIYAIGGHNKSGNLSSAEAYDIKSNKWTKLKPMAAPRSSLQTTVLNGEIYAIGGIKTGDGGIGESVATVEKYNPVENTWVTLKPMNMEREYHRLATINGKIYAIGGSPNSSVQSTVEVYDTVSNTWMTKTPMSIPRMQFGMEIIGGKIYVIGGCGADPTTDNTLATVEMYDPAKNEWTKKASMKTPRFSFQTEVIDGKIYAIGGLSIKTGNLSSVEVYDPVSDKWTAKKPMNTPRSWFQTAVVNGKIIVIGGWKKVGDYLSKSFISSVEEYNPTYNTWAEKASIFPARSLFQTVTIGSGIYAIGGAVGSNTQAEPGTNSVEMYRMEK